MEEMVHGRYPMSAIQKHAEAVKDRIKRALLCAIGQHEPWERRNVWNGGTDVVRMDIHSDMHDDVHCCVCKHCRTVYVRKRDE